MTRFEWTEEQRKSAVQGSTVCVEGSPTYDAGRYYVTGQIEGFLLVMVNGANASVPWHRADPTTLVAPDTRQLDMFSGGKV